MGELLCDLKQDIILLKARYEFWKLEKSIVLWKPSADFFSSLDVNLDRERLKKSHLPVFAIYKQS